MDSGNLSRTEGFRQVSQLREQEEMRRFQAEEPSTSMTNNPQSSPLKSMASAKADNVKFTFICECFFMTARVLNLGLIKALSDFKSLVQVSYLCIWCCYIWQINRLLLSLLKFYSTHDALDNVGLPGHIFSLSLFYLVSLGNREEYT